VKIKGIIFDFDGLICDTESTELHAWEKLYADYDIPFPFGEYQKTIGAVHNDESPLWMLKSQAGVDFDIENARKKLHLYHKQLNEIEPLRPGVLDYLNGSINQGIKIGLASSSPRTWVDFHLKRLGIMDYFECIKTFNDVIHTKPDPELFLLTIRCLELDSHETIALEDSINGVTAAKAAGLITVAVPNEVTRIFNFDKADLCISSLEDFSLEDMINHFDEI